MAPRTAKGFRSFNSLDQIENQEQSDETNEYHPTRKSRLDITVEIISAISGMQHLFPVHHRPHQPQERNPFLL